MATATARKTKAQPESKDVALLRAQLEKANAELASLRRVQPVSTGAGMIDSGDFPVGLSDGDVTMPTSPGSAATLVRPQIEPVDAMPPQSLLEELAFMEELITIKVHESNDQYPEPCISTWNNGRHQLFVKGMKQTVKRKFVEVLARSKPTRYGNVEYVDENGNHRVRWPRRTTPAYPFVVIRDDNPRGRDWLKRILAQD